MRRFTLLIVAAAVAGLAIVCMGQAKPAGVMLQEALYAEETQGNLDTAMKIYQQIIEDSTAQRSTVAQAMYRLGMCQMKKQNEAEARQIFEKLVAQFSDQQDVIDKVGPLLDEIGGPDPAALMPAGTKVYLEFGSPGRQIETILNMLKGTPYANPLSALKTGQQKGQKSPGDILGALLNPSMMAEFKKVKGLAAGVVDINQNNPPLVVVLYPGKSDALRGLILAGLGMVGQPGEPIEDMNIINIPTNAGAAYDDTVVLIAQPPELLQQTIKRYRAKGPSTLGSLAEANKTFSKLNRKIRQKNLMTLWIDAAGTYSAVEKLARQTGGIQQLQLANSIVDFNSIQDIVVTRTLEPTSSVDEITVNFRDGQDCLLYNILRTPNLTRGGFASVPPGAVGVISFALMDANGPQAEAAQKTVKRLTGLDFGREIFANIEQINVFAVPAKGTDANCTFTDALSSFGISITSRNPQHTRLLLDRFLGIAELAAAAKAGQAPQQTQGPKDNYLVGVVNGERIYCRIDQAGDTTVLAFSPQVVEASLNAVRTGKGPIAQGPLSEYLNAMPPTASKLVLVNAGGAIRIADSFIKAKYNNVQNPAHKTLEQLAVVCDKAVMKMNTIETDNMLVVRSSTDNIPPMDGVFPLIMQLKQYDIKAKAEATEPVPADGATPRIDAKIHLGWKAGVGAVKHKVYFGTSPDKLQLLAEVNTPDEVNTPAVKPDTKYYWRVDEVLQDSTVVKGRTWSFAMTGKLVGWWKFDEAEGATAADSSGNGNNGTLQGSPVWRPQDGKLGGALEFNGRSDYVKIDNESGFDIVGQITISAWVNIRSVPQEWTGIVTKGDSAWRVSTDFANNVFHFGLTRQDKLNGRTTVSSNQWHHVLCVYDGQTMSIYIDGKLDTSRQRKGAIGTNDYPVYIGENAEIKNRFFDGLIDDVRIYNYALSNSEITALYEGK